MVTEVGATDITKTGKEKNKVKIYFGIFFDGTNNNRLQVLKGKQYRLEKASDEEDVHSMFNSDILADEDDYIDYMSKVSDENCHKYQYYKQSIDNIVGEGKTINDDNIINALINNIKQLNSLENEINARRVDDAQITKIYKKKFGLSKEEQDIYRNDYTNIALLEPFYGGSSKNDDFIFRIYICGSGTSNDINKGENTIGLGFGQGETGVIQKVIDVYNSIYKKLIRFPQYLVDSINFDVFGFSRGATSARILASVLKNKQSELSKFIIKQSSANQLVEYLDIITIRFLGIYDTVSSVGVLEKNNITNIIGDSTEYWVNKATILSNIHKKVWSRNHQNNVKDLGLNEIKSNFIFHICAKDEYRENFALVTCNNNESEELYVPGCHADVGGGYNHNFKYKIKLLNEQIIFGHGIDKDVKFLIDKKSVFDCLKDDWKGLEDKIKDYSIYKYWDKSIIKDKVIEFVYKRLPGYNYVTLHIMSEKANATSNNEIFNTNIGTKFSYEKFSITKDLYEKIKRGCDLEPGEYEYLKKNYLHFSSNYETIPVNIPNLAEIRERSNTREINAYYQRIKYK